MSELACESCNHTWCIQRRAVVERETRIATLEAENAALRADLARVTGELIRMGWERDRYAAIAETLPDEALVQRDAARASLAEAVRLLEEDGRHGCCENAADGKPVCNARVVPEPCWYHRRAKLISEHRASTQSTHTGAKPG